MNKAAIKNFAVWARRKLIADISYRAGLMGIAEGGIKAALPQSTGTTEFYDIGTAEPYSISGEAVRQRRRLVEAIRQKEAETDYKTAYQYIIEEVAYTWFNRLIAVRFMEVNEYLPSRIRVLSSETGKVEPDLVTTPFDADLPFTEQEKQTVIQLKLDSQLDEVFRLLFIKQCNALNAILPNLFEKTSDYTELLLSLSVIDEEGVVYHLVHDIPESDFNVEQEGQVEIIGWLYQYYNTEPKDETFALLKKNVKITKERIPSATQLFTPDWIVRYMVENSLGRLWVERDRALQMTNYTYSDLSKMTYEEMQSHRNGPVSEEELAKQFGWKYYLPEAEQEPEVAEKLAQIRAEYKTLNPEDIKVIDPCMGSGHILVYCFDVLMQIYEAQGYSQRDAAQSILEYNLYGLDIDDRAAQLAYFAVMMKARQYDRRIFTRGIETHIYAIQESNNVNRRQLSYFGAGMTDFEKNTALSEMNGLLDVLKDAKEYGSILNVDNYNWDLLRRFAENIDTEEQLSLDSIGWEETQEQLRQLIEVGHTLAQKYDVVVTNPPYMGGSGMSTKLSEFVKKNYPDTKSDMSTVCMEKTISMCNANGYMAMINIPVWMFLSSYEKLRNQMLANNTIVNMVHPGRGIFGSDFGAVTFVIGKSHIAGYKGHYHRLFDKQGEVKSVEEREQAFFAGIGTFAAQQDNFSKIPGSPVAYWVSDKVFKCFREQTLGDCFKLLAGTSTGDNTLYQRNWYEVGYNSISRLAPKDLSKRWYPCNTGGEFRKYSVNSTCIIDWDNDGYRIKHHINNSGKIGSAVRNRDYYFKSGITWNKLSSSNFGVRFVPEGYISDDTARMILVENQRSKLILMGFLCSKVCSYFLKILSPTMSFTNSELQRIPLMISNVSSNVEKLVQNNYSISIEDRDSFETSWDFITHPLITYRSGAGYADIPMDKWQYRIADAYHTWESNAAAQFDLLKKNEEELNRIFIDIYGLQDELTPEVEGKDVTVRKADLQRDIKSLLSYAVGCMFGRYSLDMDGLAYAGGEWDDSKYSTFLPDEDNVIPITDEEYLEDDIVGLLCAWLKKVYGADTLEENLDFIAAALGNKGSTSREIIRNYFLNDFIKDHIKTYQKRPIYWLFDSGKQNGFKALIYLHRYTPDTIGNLRIDYLHRMQRIYESETGRMQDMIDHSTNPREVAAATKRKEKLQKQLKECREYDEKIGHLALSRIELDLDDGVKVNYEKVQTASDGKKYQVLAKI